MSRRIRLKRESLQLARRAHSVAVPPPYVRREHSCETKPIAPRAQEWARAGGSHYVEQSQFGWQLCKTNPIQPPTGGPEGRLRETKPNLGAPGTSGGRRVGRRQWCETNPIAAHRVGTGGPIVRNKANCPKGVGRGRPTHEEPMMRNKANCGVPSDGRESQYSIIPVFQSLPAVRNKANFRPGPTRGSWNTPPHAGHIRFPTGGKFALTVFPQTLGLEWQLELRS